MESRLRTLLLWIASFGRERARSRQRDRFWSDVAEGHREAAALASNSRNSGLDESSGE